MLAYLGPKPDLPEINRFLFLPALALLLGLLISEFTLIDKPTYRGNGCRRDLYQILPLLPSHLKRLGYRYNAKLLPAFAYQANFPSDYSLVNAVLFDYIQSPP